MPLMRENDGDGIMAYPIVYGAVTVPEGHAIKLSIFGKNGEKMEYFPVYADRYDDYTGFFWDVSTCVYSNVTTVFEHFGFELSIRRLPHDSSRPVEECIPELSAVYEIMSLLSTLSPTSAQYRFGSALMAMFSTFPAEMRNDVRIKGPLNYKPWFDSYWRFGDVPTPLPSATPAEDMAKALYLMERAKETAGDGT